VRQRHRPHADARQAVDIDRCLYAPVDDVHEMYEEYLVKKEAKTLPWG